MSIGKSPKAMTNKELISFFKVYTDEKGRLKRVMQEHQVEKMCKVVAEIRRRFTISRFDTQTSKLLAEAVYSLEVE